jgi:hypothetical protein
MGVTLLIELTLGSLKPSVFVGSHPENHMVLHKRHRGIYVQPLGSWGNMLKAVWDGFKNLISWYWGVLSDFWGGFSENPRVR